MGARRRAGPVIILATLLSAAWLLCRPYAVPELLAGSRRPSSAATAELAASIAWPAPLGPAVPEAGAPDAQPYPYDADDPLRDAPADASYRLAPAFLSAGSAPSAGGAAATRSAASAAARAARSQRPAGEAARSFRDEPSRATPPSARGVAPSAQPALRRLPLAAGPAAPEAAPGRAERSAVDVRRGAVRADAGGAWRRRSGGTFPLFKPPLRTADWSGRGGRAAHGARRRAKPLLLSKLLGKRAPRPPAKTIALPDLSRLDERRPAAMPDGKPAPARPYDLARVERTNPLDARTDDRKREPHWDPGQIWHDGPARGLAVGGRWLWLWKEGERVWAAPRTGEPPLLAHGGLWWGKRQGVWFAVHGGELWTWRRFSDWDGEGMMRLNDGAELVYSADFRKVAVITPGAGAVLYDALTGAELGEWLEEELPRRRPRAPSGLRLPRGI